MSDIYLKPTEDGGEINIALCRPEMSGGLDNAVYLSLFTKSWWGNSISTSAARFDSKIPDIIESELLNNDTRIEIIEEAKRVTKWMIDYGILERIDIRANIPARGILYIAATMYEPGREQGKFVSYYLNWKNQKLRIA